MVEEFSTKAGTLKQLEGKLKTAKIAPLVFFEFRAWQADRPDCLEKIRKAFEGERLIVRSSCQKEDGSEESNAGAFLSLLDVVPETLEESVQRVFDAYGSPDDRDQVLIQPMLQNVVRSGVVFSHDPNTCGPYRVINWNEGADTEAVTGGIGGNVWQQAARSPGVAPPNLVSVIQLVEELLELFGGKPVDCEFAATDGGDGETLWLLQARPLILRRDPEPDAAQEARLDRIFRRVQRGMCAHPYVKGKKTVYGVMPDWNPAEIVGIRPKPLALSLYRELITDAIWAYQRHNYGYRNLRSFPLMPHFAGLPYIDIRLSFNSFIPADLEDRLAERLADYYLDRLLGEPTLHDKVEFEIVYSCYTLDLPERLKKLGEAGFTESEQRQIADSLRRLTNRIIHPDEGLWKGDSQKIDILNRRRDQLEGSRMDQLERVYWLIEDAKRYGTLPFAGLARAGFVAVQMLKSLVAVGVFSESDYHAFLGSVSTVSGKLSNDRAALDRTSFLSRYGHLRPGTYDILSPRYDEAPDLYFDWNEANESRESPPAFSLTLPQMRELVMLLNEHGLHPDPVGLLDFMQAGIEQRELSKFHFSKNLSDVLSLVASYGERLGFSREDLAYSNIAVFKDLHVSSVDPYDALAQSIREGKARYSETLSTALPPLIARPEDVWGFHLPDTSPNFITQKQVTARVCSAEDRQSLKGAIVCLPNADPGFDWLFACSIAGLVTAWGGINSHMAIRAGELGLPAVIGAGERMYKQWSAAKRLHIDCASRKVELLK